MNAIYCEISLPKTATPPASFGLYTRTGAASAPRRCPMCDSIIYSRRHRLCGVCAHELPGEVLFTAQECANVSSILREERQRHRAWLQRFSLEN